MPASPPVRARRCAVRLYSTPAPGPASLCACVRMYRDCALLAKCHAHAPLAAGYQHTFHLAHRICSGRRVVNAGTWGRTGGPTDRCPLLRSRERLAPHPPDWAGGDENGRCSNGAEGLDGIDGQSVYSTIVDIE
ncbi:hypothetical protein CC85DRAFT_15932 [Cutaneotrichosporon oleaginosum]|uniref:Uncharacterized protein n=1 Tax=Cutaneotrichosporon oleaginosum TaxID=879819 RepID=A0A0J0XTA9_9TREE|nr:uncharacterized protein CC85DRAFT_15932 [Cutaneotrichosporon oleaginosum]KLT44333.1 hypothetical protein CC85DRAFT_15932 [Cutaneotrichosporon oleaginosum]TXT07939.1 hypothetical protein COLE_04863 [Cutaneotrichosporon oleaginosum]